MQKEVLLMVPTAKRQFKKPEGRPQKEVIDQGLEAWWCLRPLKVYSSLSATPLGLNLDLVTSDNQACSQRKGTLIFSQVPLRTNDGKTSSVRETGNNFCSPQQHWDLAGIFYHQHSTENFGEGGEGWRHERFAASHPNTTHSPTGIHLERTWSPEPGYFTDGKSGPKTLSHWSFRENTIFF